MSPTNAVDDPARLEALDAYGILDTPAEAGFDGIVHLASHLCDAPVALVSLVAGDRQWFKARLNFPSCETDLNISVCAHALAQPDDLLVIPDLSLDPRTSGNPLVAGPPHMRFYAGAPLRTPSGLVLGSLCVLDGSPRPGGLTAVQAANMRVLAGQVMDQLELRRAITARDRLRATENQAFLARDALRDLQSAVTGEGKAPGDIAAAVLAGAMRAIPAAEGACFERVGGGRQQCIAALGTLSGLLRRDVASEGLGAGLAASEGRPRLLTGTAADGTGPAGIAPREGVGGSAAFAPLADGTGAITLHSARAVAFGTEDLELLALFAGVAATGLAEADARAARRANELYWRGLFHRLGEGFVVGEAVRDAAGQVVDWRYVEVNPAWGTMIGSDPTRAVGRTVREVIPGIEDAWVEDVAHVLATRESRPFTRQVAVLGKWFEGRAFPLDGDRFGIIFLDVSRRVESDARRAALVALGERLQDMSAAHEMTRDAAETVGRTLGATRAGFGHVGGDVETVDIQPDWTVAGQASIAGTHRFDDYGDLGDHLRRGEPLVVEDVLADPRTREAPAPLIAMGTRSFVNMPVRKMGRTVAVFLVHDSRPRSWTAEEVAFLRNVADRLEVGVARLRAEELQAALNGEIAHRLKNTLAIVQSIAQQTLRGVSERDRVEAFERRLLALSRAHDILLQKSWAAARMRALMEGVLALQADLDRFALDGADMDVGPEAALSLSLLLHELATNALKYGSLSVPGGRVRIAWATEAGPQPSLVLGWTETGGPAATAPAGRGGFGSRLIRMGLVGTRRTDLRFGTGGLSAEFRAPLSEIQIQAH